MTDYPGRAERELARSLIEALPPSVRAQLRFVDADLEPAAEHVIYTAMRHHRAPRPLAAADALVRGVGRPIAAHLRVGQPTSAPVEVVVLVTLPVHARLFAPIADGLVALGERRPLVVAARTGETTHARLDGVTDADLRDFGSVRSVPRLVGHAVRTSVALRQPAEAWTWIVGQPQARRLSAVLRAAIPRLAIDVARLSALLDAVRPRVVACFSESGLLARIAPETARPRGIPVLDLPHAESADPWGTSRVGYEGVAVFGPRAAEVMRLAGIAPERIVEIGPLGYDDLLLSAKPDIDAHARRVLFASQPVDEGRPHLATAVKRLALESAVAITRAVAPAALHVLPHPKEDDRQLREVVASVTGAAGVRVEVEPAGNLHAFLPGAFALVTVSSQSVFEAVLSGVPAVAVHPPDLDVPVTHVADGIALGASTVHEASRIGALLVDRDHRSEVVQLARTALGDKLGPLDGRAAHRAARWLHDAGREHRLSERPGRPTGPRPA